MRPKTRVLFLLAAVLLLGFVCPTPARARELPGRDFRYALLEDGSARILGWEGSTRELAVPGTLDGHPVRELGEGAFADCRQLQRVTLPEGLCLLGDRAFSGCSALVAVDLPQSLARIGDRAFFYCVSLSELALPEGLRFLGEGAFSGCRSLKRLRLPDSLEEVPGNPFERTSISPELSPDHPRLALLDEALFDRAEGRLIAYAWGSGAETYAVPTGTRTIGPRAFSGCEDLRRVSLPEGLLEVGDWTFVNCRSLLAAELPGSLLSLGEGAFFGCERLKELALPEGLTALGTHALSYCGSLTRLRLPDSLKEVPGNPFVETPVFLELSPEHPRLALSDGVLFDREEGRLLSWPYAREKEQDRAHWTEALWEREGPAYAVPLGTRAVAPLAFASVRGLAHVTLPEGLRDIGSQAFLNCDGLVTVSFPESLERVGEEAFSGCTRLRAAELPEGLSHLGDGAFAYCFNLDRLTLPGSLARIGRLAFYECGSLLELDLPSGLLEIGDRAFAGTGLRELSLPEGLLGIGDLAFYACDSLTRLRLPDSLVRIGANPFAGTPVTLSLPSAASPFVLLDGVLFDRKEGRLISYPFSREAAEYAVPPGVRAVGERAFHRCRNLKIVTLPGGLERIGDLAFAGCDGMERMNLPGSLSDIGASAFESCERLELTVERDSFAAAWVQRQGLPWRYAVEAK